MKTSELIKELSDLGYSFGQGAARLTTRLLSMPNLTTWPGSSQPDQHHNYEGGLVQHIYEVVKLSLANADVLCNFADYDINRRRLFLAALYHDIGKLWDYARDSKSPTGWSKLKHYKEIYHLPRSAIVWSNNVQAEAFCDGDEHDDVLHVILAHHGLREWGSPVSPRTRIAWVLHLSDSMSARVNDCDKRQ